MSLRSSLGELEKCGRSDLRTSVLDELEQWIAWQAARVQQRKPEELRVVYLCGPEPLNDLRVRGACIKQMVTIFS